VIVASCLVASIAHAQPSSDEGVDKPAAVALFEEGRVALAAGNADLACKKFEQSLRKDPRAVGTLLNLGLCNERQGKVASALSLFIEAYDRATEAALPEQRRAAEEHITALRPQVPFLVIEHTAQPLAGAKLLVDDQVIALDDKEVPVDPGPHTITFTAPGRMPYETSVSVKVATRTKLRLPELAVPRQGLVRESWRRTWGRPMTIGGGVLVLAGIGGVVFAKNRYDSQFEDPDGSGPMLPPCGQRPEIDGQQVCDREGKRAVDSARNLSTTASVVGALGLVTFVAGTYLWWSAPDAVVITPTIGHESAGVTLTGRF
jgi:hypothetical protein